MQDSNLKRIMKLIGKVFIRICSLVLILHIASQFVVYASIKNETKVASRNRSQIEVQKEKKNSIDVLMVGDSECYNSISPMQIWKEHGITSFVCGQSAQKIQESYYMIKTALKTQSPKVVVLETNTIFNKEDGVSGLQTSFSEFGNYVFPVFQLHNIWKAAIVEQTNNYKDYFKGYEMRAECEPYLGGEYMNKTDEKEEMSPLVRGYLDRIVELCKENQIQLCFVSAPSPQNYNYRKHNTLLEYTNEKNIKYLNLNLILDELGISWKMDTPDNGDHMNLLGAMKVSKYIGEYLVNNYQFAGHQKDDNYKQWNQTLENYEERIKEVLNLINNEILMEAKDES